MGGLDEKNIVAVKGKKTPQKNKQTNKQTNKQKTCISIVPVLFYPLQCVNISWWMGENYVSETEAFENAMKMFEDLGYDIIEDEE